MKNNGGAFNRSSAPVLGINLLVFAAQAVNDDLLSFF
jgi:hypothetical protein